MSSQTESVSFWIRALKNGDNAAATHLFDRYQAQLRNVAKSLLGHSPQTVADEEDVVIRSFYAFLRRTSQGAYPGLETRDDLWRLLVTITRSFAWKQSRFFGRTKRRQKATDDEILRSLASQTLEPDALASMSETLTYLLDSLSDPELRQIALGRLEGKTNAQIAESIDRSERTVERRVRLIRSQWSAQFDAGLV